MWRAGLHFLLADLAWRPHPPLQTHPQTTPTTPTHPSPSSCMPNTAALPPRTPDLLALHKPLRPVSHKYLHGHTNSALFMHCPFTCCSYVDARHDYCGCLEDMEMWYAVVAACPVAAAVALSPLLLLLAPPLPLLLLPPLPLPPPLPPTLLPLLLLPGGMPRLSGLLCWCCVATAPFCLVTRPLLRIVGGQSSSQVPSWLATTTCECLVAVKASVARSGAASEGGVVPEQRGWWEWPFGIVGAEYLSVSQPAASEWVGRLK